MSKMAQTKMAQKYYKLILPFCSVQKLLVSL